MSISKKKLFLYPILASMLGAIIFAAGVFTAHTNSRPYQLFKAAERNIAQRHTSGNSVRPTIFLNLNIKKDANQTIPTSRRGAGGGVTSAGDELIVINHEGSIYKASDEGVEKLKITAADNHFAEYQTAAESDKYKDLFHRFYYFRYNDILAFATENQKHLAISYTEWLPDQECYGTAVAVLDYPLDTASISDVSATKDDWNIVFRTNPCLPLKTESAAIEGHMAGGRIDHAGEGRIILGSGDYAWDGLYAPEILAQEMDNDYGKVIEIDIINGQSKIISFGHRNMQGVVVEDDGQIWVVEHGPRGGDELNRVQEGGNFGWPMETLGTRYNKLPWPNVDAYGRHDEHLQPMFAWVPSVATSSLTQIKNFHTSWDGDLLVGSFHGGKAYRMRIQNEKIVFAEPITLIEGRIRDIHQHTDGSIVVWSDDETLTYITALDSMISDTFVEDFLEVENYDELTATNIKKVVDSCLECHALDPFDHTAAPGLGAIYNSEIASTDFQNYSQALKDVGGKWTDAALTEYLSNPTTFAPGSIMPNPGINDPKVIEGIIKLLKQSNTSY